MAANGFLTVRQAMLMAVLAALLGCSPYRIVDVPSTNQSSRVNHLVIHFTSENFSESYRLLATRTDVPVSAHYLIPEPDDPTYAKRRLLIHRLVPEERRAWHAGRSSWAGQTGLNASSIGIELVNRSRCEEEPPDAIALQPIDEACRFYPFADSQIDLLEQLARDILKRYPGIDPVDVVGHADIAPDRRVDPGPVFPWKRLHDAGIGAWYDDEAVAAWRRQFRSRMPGLDVFQRALRAYGYAVEVTGEQDIAFQRALRAFQMHFTPQAVTLQADVETAAVLYALLDKYRPDDAKALADDLALRAQLD